MMADGDRAVPRVRLERRQHVRVDVSLPAKLFVPTDGREASCKVLDMSAAGARIASDFAPEAGSLVVVYIDGFGRFECDVIQADHGLFSVSFRISSLKRERVGEQLTTLMKQGAIDSTVLRRHERTATKGMANFIRANGDVVPCEVLDLSLSGLSLKTDGRPPVGEMVVVGQMSGRVVRHHENGIAIEFVSAAGRRSEQSRPLSRMR
jgi:hypothetical protein